MFDNRIFDPDHLGTEEEEKMLQYIGWAILARIKAQNWVQAIEWIKHTFTGDGTEFSEQDNRYFLSYNSDDRAIELVPDKIKLKDPEDERAVTFNMIIEAPFFGLRKHQENTHLRLSDKFLLKIPNRKAFVIKENKRFPIKK